MTDVTQRHVCHIGIIDDDLMIRDLMAEVLLDEGFQPVLWDASEDPVAFASRESFDALLLDLRIGSNRAAEPTFEALIDVQSAASAPIIVCSADITFLDTHADALVQAGFLVLVKPFDLDALINCVRQAVDERCVMDRSASTVATDIPQS